MCPEPLPCRKAVAVHVINDEQSGQEGSWTALESARSDTEGCKKEGDGISGGAPSQKLMTCKSGIAKGFPTEQSD